jgi:hypothetical protein
MPPPKAGAPSNAFPIVGGDQGWVRKHLIPTAVVNPQRPNGIAGDAPPFTVALGKLIFDVKVDAAVRRSGNCWAAPRCR